eukprot:6198389-Pleurochrysis_carterae.AAC.5
MGLPNVAPHHARELEQANELVRHTACLLRAAQDAGSNTDCNTHLPVSVPDAFAVTSWNTRRIAGRCTRRSTHTGGKAALAFLKTAALRPNDSCSLITFPQCALGATAQKFTSLLASPGVAPSLASLSNISCAHTTHAMRAGGTKAGNRCASAYTAAYPPDLTFLLARVLGGLRAPAHPAATVQPPTSALPCGDYHLTPQEPDVTLTEPPAAKANADSATTPHTKRQPKGHFRRGLGTYPLRSHNLRAPVLLTRRVPVRCFFRAQNRICIHYGAGRRPQDAQKSARRQLCGLDCGKVPQN